MKRNKFSSNFKNCVIVSVLLLQKLKKGEEVADQIKKTRTERRRRMKKEIVKLTKGISATKPLGW